MPTKMRSRVDENDSRSSLCSVVGAAGVSLLPGRLPRSLPQLHRRRRTAEPAAHAETTAACRPPSPSSRSTPPISSRPSLVSGSLVPRDEILVAPEVEGLRVLELMVDEGDRVKKGDVLATLVPESLDAQVAQNDAALARAEAAISQRQEPDRRSRSASSPRPSRASSAPSPLKTVRLPVREHLRPARGRGQDRRRRSSSPRATASSSPRPRRRRSRRSGASCMWRRSNTEVTAPADGLVSRRTARIGGMALRRSASRCSASSRAARSSSTPRCSRPSWSRSRPTRRRASTVAGVGDVDGTVRLVSPEVDKATRLGRVRIFLGDDPRLRIGAFARGTHRDGAEHAASPCRRRPSCSTPTAPSCRSSRDGKVERSDVKIGLTPAASSRCAKGSPPATWSSPAPAPSCATATPCAPIAARRARSARPS